MKYTDKGFSMWTGCFGRKQISEFQPLENSALVSIRDYGSAPPKLKDGWADVIYLEFADVVRGQDGMEFEHAPSHTDTMRMYDFIVLNQKRHIFANCEAGISRSGAVREFLNRMGWFVDPLLYGNKHIYPNQTVLSDLQWYQRELGLIEH